MLLTITLKHPSATDLGYLLGKHPDKVQEFDLSFGKATVFYPVSEPGICTAALLVELNPVELLRDKQWDGNMPDQYVNDRPYVASSFLSSAISHVFGSALNGTCKGRPELAEAELDLEAQISVVHSHAGEALIRELFEPLGYVTESEGYADHDAGEGAPTIYFTVTLHKKTRLMLLLRHLYVLLPVADNDKHYYVGNHETEKLLEKGEEWLAEHPKMELITRRYLGHRKSLVESALEILVPESAATEAEETASEEKAERTLSLHETRLNEIEEKLKQLEVKSVLDLGCGEGKLLRRLLRMKGVERITGMDVSWRSLEIAKRRLNWETMSPAMKQRITLLHGALTYTDKRLEGYDAAVLSEVIEHLDPPRLDALARMLFHYARPGVVLITTPNSEYNVLFPLLPAGKFRHSDHRFEWTRAEFESWATQQAEAANYSVQFFPLGEVHESLGGASQMALFRKKNSRVTGAETEGETLPEERSTL